MPINTTQLEQPNDINESVWRYMDFTKFMYLLNDSSLYLCRADLFEDKFEGSITKKNLEERNEKFQNYHHQDPNMIATNFLSTYCKDLREFTFINCWHLNNYQSAAMWKLYSKIPEAIAIQTSYSKLVNALSIDEKDLYIGKISYIDFDKDNKKDANTLDAYKYKRKSFEHEKEVRIIYQEPYIYELENEKFNINKKKIQSKKGINIEFPLNELIENIYVSPVASDKFLKQVDILCKKYEIKAEIIKSDLYDINSSIY